MKKILLFLLSTIFGYGYNVSNSDDSGPNSFRYAVTEQLESAMIDFNSPVYTIPITSATISIGQFEFGDDYSLTLPSAIALFPTSGSSYGMSLGDTGTAATPLINVGGTTTPGAILDIEVNIDEAGVESGFRKLGVGIFQLSGNNTFTGGVELLQGTLSIASNSGLGTGPLVINNISGATPAPATLELANGVTITNNIELKSPSGSQNIALASGATSATLSGIISDSTAGSGPALTKTGEGTITLNGANTYTVGTTISAGTLAIGSGGSLASTGNLTVSGASTFEMVNASADQTVANLVSDADTTISLGTNNLTFGTGDNTAVAGRITGTGGSLTKQGSGTVTMDGINDYTGGTTITAGNITLGAGALMPARRPVTLSGTSTLDVSGATENQEIGDLTTASGSTITVGSKVLIFGSSNDTEIAGAITTTGGSFSKQGTGTATLSGANTLPNENSLIQGTIVAANNAALGAGDLLMYEGATLGVDSSITLTNNLKLKQGTVNIDVASGTGTVNGVISLSAADPATLTKTGAGELVLGGTNTYFLGGTTLSEGQLTLANSSAISSPPFAMAEGTILALNNTISIPNLINLTGSTSAIINVASGTGTLSGAISGNTATLTKTGDGTLTLSGINTYTSGTVISTGTLALSGVLESSGDVTVNGTSTFDISGITSTQTIGDLNTASGATLNLGDKSLTFGTANDATIAGVIAGAGGSALVKTGTGTVTFSGTSTFAETMTVNQGTAVINGVFPGAINASSSSTVKGTGTIDGLLTVASGGTLRPGNSIGTINLDSLTLDAGSITTIEFDPTTTSLINVTGEASLNGTLNLVHEPGAYAESASYEILTAGTRTGEFSAITGGLEGFNFTLNYTGNSVFLLYSGGSDTTTIDTDGLTGNILKFANYLNAYAPASDEYSALARISGTELYNGLNSASPARLAFAPYVTQLMAFSLSNIVSEHLAKTRFFNSHSISSKLTNLLMPGENSLLAGKNGEESFQDCCCDPLYSLWINGFVGTSYQAGESQNLPFNFVSGGIMAGLEFQSAYEYDVLGFTFAYANSQIKDTQNTGSSNISSLAASLYADYSWEHFYIQAAFWGVYNLISNCRNISYPDVNTKAWSNLDGWQINPHLELGCMFGSSSFEVQPYAAFDYVVNWENGYQENGAGSLNMKVKAQQSSMLQSEAGLKFYQSIERSYGRLGFQEGISYINRTPFDTGRVTSSIFGATDFVTLKSFTHTQNLGAINLTFFAETGKNRDILISLGYEGQFGDQYISNQVMLSLSRVF